jgi:DNA mismatch repair protein MutL
MPGRAHRHRVLRRRAQPHPGQRRRRRHDGGRARACGGAPRHLQARRRRPHPHHQSMGFRGEALASIGSVSRLRLASRVPGADSAYEIRIEAGRKGEVRPAALAGGTDIEVRDLFFAVPARLKFLKSARRSRRSRRSGAPPRHGPPGRRLFAQPGRPHLSSILPRPRRAGQARIGAVMGRDFVRQRGAIAARREGSS